MIDIGLITLRLSSANCDRYRSIVSTSTRGIIEIPHLVGNS